MATEYSHNFKVFAEEFEKESDRAAVILVSAKLDELLHLALTKKLLPCPTAQDDLLRTDGPISSFSSRITLAHRLGLIDDAFAKTLHLIRRIRNDFAHESAGAQLSSGSHADRIRNLFLPFKKYCAARAKEIPSFQEMEKKGLRGQFEFSCYYCILALNEIVDSTVTIKKPESDFLDLANTDYPWTSSLNPE
jgi:DNA-binding MltR family transcriptional regulator